MSCGVGSCVPGYRKVVLGITMSCGVVLCVSRYPHFKMKHDHRLLGMSMCCGVGACLAKNSFSESLQN